ncbi:hypothetical protein [Streptomyces sp. NPDC050388]|uniref:hypothetical protein n=1 Tax=Streptomyces sp. NPDC050388 TaxID=3155781 RepID=UPI003432E786
MTTALYVILTAVLVGPACWRWGHSTARVRIVHVGAIRAQGDEQLLAQERAHFDQLVAGLDLPDDRKDTE